MEVELIQFVSPEALAQAAANHWIRPLLQTPNRSVECVAVSGGRIARLFFEAVVAAVGDRFEVLDSTHFFWADERCVAPEDAESNYRLAREHLLAPLRVAPQRIHRIPGEQAPDEGASQATSDLGRVAPRNGEGMPILDRIFLGMGEDGHVASLFPGELVEARGLGSIYAPVTASKPPPRRITLTMKVLQAARDVWVLASGPGKEQALSRSLRADGDTPLARVLKGRTQTRIYTDVRLAESQTRGVAINDSARFAIGN